MSTKIFNEIFPRKRGSKRGISPVIATILLIALTVSAAAIVYFVVVPLLQGKGELVQTGTLELIDADDDGKFDSAITTLFNLGTDTVTLEQEVTVNIYQGQIVTFTWTVTSDPLYSTQLEKDVSIEAPDNTSQIDPITQYEIIFTYEKKNLGLGRHISPYAKAGGGSGNDVPEVNYTSTALYLRTSADDPSTSRGSFPTAAGYSPLLWFMVGIFQSGVGGLESDTTDYIATNGFGSAQNYHPYIGISDTYSQSISSHTGYQVSAYNDSGRYPGCVTFRGTSFDPDDNLDWPQRGIIYMFTYIYNPTTDPMDVDLSIQSDDAYNLWVNGVTQGSGDHTSNGWRTWRSPVRVTMNPGYNIITVKTTDIGGNWDTQILFWDAGDVDAITSLVNVWPLIEPTSTYW